MPELDALRGVAVLMVLFYHGFFWSNGDQSSSRWMHLLLTATRAGWLGVDLFFVLSGFLITGILLDSRDRPDYYPRFYYRRALRILPAYFGLLVLLIASGIVHWKFALASSFFMANFAPLFGLPTEYGPLWSLAVEEQWYLVWPTVVRRLSVRAVAGVAAAITIGSWAMRLMAFRHGSRDGLWGYTWFTADGLASGALLAISLRRAEATRHRIAFAAMMLVSSGLAIIWVGRPYGVLTRTMQWGAAFQSLSFVLIFTGSLAAILLVGSSSYAQLVV